MPRFAKIFQQAKITFALVNKEHFNVNLQKLKVLIDLLEWKNINGIDPEVFSRRTFLKPYKAPCTFINICEKEDFTMSVFIIGENFTMPLHDHPQMYGFLKCIAGRIKIQSYTRINFGDSSEIFVTKDEPKILDSKSAVSFLDENKSNYHEITALEGSPAAFFDILSPPYSDFKDDETSSRHCHFYRKLMVENNLEEMVIKLERIECPETYYCDSVAFDSPSYMNALA